VSSWRIIRDVLFYVVFASAVVVFVYDVNLVFLRTPTEASMGIVQKIFYFHVPAAVAMYGGAFACFVGSFLYLLAPSLPNAAKSLGKTIARWAEEHPGWEAHVARWGDAFAKAGAETAVVFGLIVMITGPLWAAKAWGRYWTWDPRLTTSMLSVLIYVAYVVLRSFAGNGEAEKKFAAALGIVGAANLPIIHYSVQKWSGQHPVVIGKGGGGVDPAMGFALGISFLAFGLLFIALLWVRTRVVLSQAILEQLEEEALAQIPEGQITEGTT
jgi:heme exporter protein C